MKNDLKKIADFLFEMGMLAKTPRSGFFFLGSGDQSVAEHTNRTVYIGFALASMAIDVNVAKVMQICAFHDIAESRVSDLNYVHQKYNQRQEDKAINDLVSTLPFGQNIKELIDEYEDRKTKEAILAKDADNIEFIISLKEQADIGNIKAKTWIPAAAKRLKSEEAKLLISAILEVDSDHWWFGDDKDDEWWVSRGNKELGD